MSLSETVACVLVVFLAGVAAHTGFARLDSNTYAAGCKAAGRESVRINGARRCLTPEQVKALP